jgi:hypothetical protein
MGRTISAGTYGVWWMTVIALVGCGTGGAAGSSSGAVAPIYGSLSDPRRGYEVREASGEAPDSGRLAMLAQEGSLDQDDAEAAIKQHWNRMVRCYDQAGDARDFAGGPVTLRWQVGGDGRPTSVHVLTSSLGSFEVERCLTEIAAGVRFPRPQGHGKASVEYSLEFRSTGEVPVVELGDEVMSAALPAVLGRLASECHELGVDEVTATLYIDRKGTVRSIGFGSRRAFPADSAACVARTLRATPIPAAVEGGAMGRVVIALRDADVRNPPRLAKSTKSSKRRTTQGRSSKPRRK